MSRFPTVKDVESRLQRLLTASAAEPRVQALPAAAMLLASHAGTSPVSLAALEMWAPAGPVEGLQLLASPAGSNPAVKAYALRCIANTKPEKVRAGEGGVGGHHLPVHLFRRLGLCLRTPSPLPPPCLFPAPLPSHRLCCTCPSWCKHCVMTAVATTSARCWQPLFSREQLCTFPLPPTHPVVL